MSEEKQKHTKWAATGVQNLLRNELSGRYYARFTIAGKHKWVALKTDKKSVALARLAEERQKHSMMSQALRNAAGGVANMGQIKLVYIERVKANKRLKKDTIDGLVSNAVTISQTYPFFETMSPADVTRQKVELWRNRLLAEGTGRTNRFGKNDKIKPSSPRTVNVHLDVFRHMLDIAIEQGQLAVNPLTRRGLKMTLKPKKVNLPEMSAIHRVFANIEAKGSVKGPDIADFLRLLTFTGMRLGESALLTWGRVDFDKKIIKVPGYKTFSSDREIPMLADARATLLRLRARRESAAKWLGGTADLGPEVHVSVIREGQNSLTRACKEEGVARLTHHDLRDAFATQCIEAGVDIPTVSGWLGHVDGGALLMKVYAHHRREHSQAQAAKVSFVSG